MSRNRPTELQKKLNNTADRHEELLAYKAEVRDKSIKTECRKNKILREKYMPKKKWGDK